MSFIVYILFSDSCQKFYTGQTSDLANRIKEHNAGETPSIKSCRPWRLVWTYEVSSRSEGLETTIKRREAGNTKGKPVLTNVCPLAQYEIVDHFIRICLPVNGKNVYFYNTTNKY